MRDAPDFLRQFSKEEHPLDRTKHAEELLGLRRDMRTKPNTAEEVREVFLGRIATARTNFRALLTSKWQNAAQDRAAVERYLQTDLVASLTVDDYALLLSRFPGEVLTHVTRQGVRDHSGHMYHTEGEGDAHAGFESILRSGVIKPGLTLALEDEHRDARIAKMLGLEYMETREEAEGQLTRMLNPKDGCGNVVDRGAVHMAVDHVANISYGGETENEIFLVYPSIYIASQHVFDGGVAVQDDQSDVSIYPDDREAGLPVNAAIVFLPKTTPVDPRTGSRYALDAARRPRVDRALQQAAKRIAAHPAFGALREESGAWWHTEHSAIQSIERVEQQSRKREAARARRAWAERLAPACGVSPEKLERLLSYEGLERIDNAHNHIENDDPISRRQIRRELRLELLQHARNTIPAAQYWEQYFSAHPELRPSKLVYYEGDPTAALRAWKQEHGLVHRAEDGRHLGFPDHTTQHVSLNIPRLDEFTAIAKRLIDERFPRAEEGWEKAA